MKKVLHITNWYPNRWNDHETPFIKEIFDACEGVSDAVLWHVQVRNESALFRLNIGDYSDREKFLVLDTRIKSWVLIELLTAALLLMLRLWLGFRQWDIVHFHIAYPLLRFPNLTKILFGNRRLVSEHWSAYHSRFNLPVKSNAAMRIARGVCCGCPVVTVSRALLNDIEFFADAKVDGRIVPNVVDPALFYVGSGLNSQNVEPTLLMVAGWAPIKRPLLVMEAFRQLLPSHPAAQLRIIGYGKQWLEMKKFVEDNGLSGNIRLLGSRDKSSIAEELRACTVFVHPSGYETFSVVCAEALCSGKPVIASNVGGIKEFVTSDNGLLVENTVAEWSAALAIALAGKLVIDPNVTADNARARFSPSVIAKQYLDIYKDICDE